MGTAFPPGEVYSRNCCCGSIGKGSRENVFSLAWLFSLTRTWLSTGGCDPPAPGSGAGLEWCALTFLPSLRIFASFSARHCTAIPDQNLPTFHLLLSFYIVICTNQSANSLQRR